MGIGCIPFLTEFAFSEMLLVDVGGKLGSYKVPSDLIMCMMVQVW